MLLSAVLTYGETRITIHAALLQVKSITVSQFHCIIFPGFLFKTLFTTSLLSENAIWNLPKIDLLSVDTSLFMVLKETNMCKFYIDMCNLQLLSYIYMIKPPLYKPIENKMTAYIHEAWWRSKHCNICRTFYVFRFVKHTNPRYQFRQMFTMVHIPPPSADDIISMFNL